MRRCRRDEILLRQLCDVIPRGAIILSTSFVSGAFVSEPYPGDPRDGGWFVAG